MTTAGGESGLPNSEVKTTKAPVENAATPPKKKWQQTRAGQLFSRVANGIRKRLSPHEEMQHVANLGVDADAELSTAQTPAGVREVKRIYDPKANSGKGGFVQRSTDEQGVLLTTGTDQKQTIEGPDVSSTDTAPTTQDVDIRDAEVEATFGRMQSQKGISAPGLNNMDDLLDQLAGGEHAQLSPDDIVRLTRNSGEGEDILKPAGALTQVEIDAALKERLQQQHEREDLIRSNTPDNVILSDVPTVVHGTGTAENAVAILTQGLLVRDESGLPSTVVALGRKNTDEDPQADDVVRENNITKLATKHSPGGRPGRFAVVMNFPKVMPPDVQQVYDAMPSTERRGLAMYNAYLDWNVPPNNQRIHAILPPQYGTGVIDQDTGRYYTREEFLKEFGGAGQ